MTRGSLRRPAAAGSAFAQRPACRRAGSKHRALTSSATAGGDSFFIRRRKRKDWDHGPTFGLSKEEAVQLQLQASGLQKEGTAFV